MDAIKVEGLTKRFGDVAAVSDLSFTIPSGKVTGFLGPNGAGKSTTLRMILGLVRPNAGDIAVLGGSYTDLNDPVRTVGALLEVDQFHPKRSGRNHLRIIAIANGIREARVDEVLEMVELAGAADRKVGGYSLGMKQRLGLAAALLGDPRVLVLDEPANGLDPAGIRWLRNFLKGFASEGRAVFVSSHQLSEIAAMADDVIVIDRGRFVIHASVPELTGGSAVAVRVVTPQPERLEVLLDESGVTYERLSTDALRVTASREVVGELAAGAGIPIFGLEEEERSLEDVFFELTKADEGSVQI